MKNLRGKGLLIIAIPLVFEVAFALLVMMMDRAARLAQEAEWRDSEVNASAYHLLQLLVDAETAIRGYVISGKPAFTGPYDHAMIEVPRVLREFHTLSAKSGAKTDAVERHVFPLLRYHTQQRDRVAGGDRAEAVAIVASGEGKQKMDAFRTALSRFLADHRAATNARARRYASARQGLRNVILGGLVANVVVAVAMAIFFTTSITRRLAVLVDNTYRVQRQEPLRGPLRGDDEIAQLDARFHDMAVALAKSRAELESFSYYVSHDLRAPLRAVNGYARMVEEDFAERLDEEGKRYLATIRSEAQRMGQLIDDLLAFSRLGRQPLQLATVDVAALAREALAHVPGANDERVIVQFDSPPPALADRAMLRQVFVNLLSNAIKFSARNDRIQVDVGGSANGKENLYWVRDRGAGFDMRFAEKLFGVFQRLHTDHDFEGTGVGLAIVHRVIDKHRGRIWAEAEQGRGACFFFTLPRAQENER